MSITSKRYVCSEREEILDKNKRKLKVNATSGYKYKDTPTIQLKGEYLNACGFSIGTPITVTLSDDKIVIEKAPQ